MPRAARNIIEILEEKTRQSDTGKGDQTPLWSHVVFFLAFLVRQFSQTCSFSFANSLSPTDPVYLPRAAVTRRHSPGARLSIIARKRERE